MTHRPYNYQRQRLPPHERDKVTDDELHVAFSQRETDVEFLRRISSQQHTVKHNDTTSIATSTARRAS